MRTPVVIPPDPNPLTPEQYAKKLGISRKRFRELSAITDKALAEYAHKSIEELETEMDELGPLPDIFGTEGAPTVVSKKTSSRKTGSRRPAGRQSTKRG